MSVPTYRLHKATGQALVTLNRKDHYLGKHGTDDSRQLYDELVAEYQKAGVVEPKLKRTSPNPDGPAYRLHKQSKQAVVTISGRDYYLGPYNSSASKAEYFRLKAEYFASGCSPTFGARSDEITVVELLAGYHLPNVKGSRSFKSGKVRCARIGTSYSSPCGDCGIYASTSKPCRQSDGRAAGALRGKAWGDLLHQTFDG